ncbi:MAG: FAD-binding and (Fe-S)-binding domain-containing protein [Succinivibrionaceae bacterium]
MIPKITPSTSVESHYLDFFNDLKNSEFSGDVEFSYSSRLAVATDNSVYQQIPQGVVLPKNIKDVQIIASLANTNKYSDITFAPRGGGTGTNGQSLTPGVVVDLSRHMRGISDLNVDKRTVYVQAGVIKDYLNQEIKQYGLFFSPELSTSNRATFGGMISNDSSGQGSLKYGKTSQHVLEVDVVLLDGTLVNFRPVSGDELKAKLSLSSMEGNIYRTVYDICTSKSKEIQTTFPNLNRFLTGYDLKHVYDVKTNIMDLSRIICGAEGTLAFIVGAKLDLTLIPSYRSLVVIKYDSFDSALRHAPVMVKAQALSVETVDSKVLNLAKQDIVWYSVKDLITEVPNIEMEGINIVEFAGTDASEEEQKLEKLVASLDKELSKKNKQKGVIGYQICKDLKDIQAIYGMRKKAVGLLGNASGDAKPIAFTEDTVVPPEHLADYIIEFRSLLDSKNLSYGMFGHVDSGVLHVRPALDLCDPEQEVVLRSISDSVVKLTAKYGGIMWGEHGRGYRSEYGPEFFGELFVELRKVKAAFDSRNQINPGKICVPLGDDDHSLVSVDGVKRGTFDRQIPKDTRQSFKSALNCNGNGLCFNFDKSSPMCPTYKYLGDRRQSPKGRAGLMREWLRQLELQGVNPLTEEVLQSTSLFSLKDFIMKVYNTCHKQDDFSNEVKDVMDCCLACKACASVCPIKVDVPDFRSRFLNMYYGRYLRPIGDIFAKTIETTAPIMAKTPAVVNTVNSFAPIKYITKKIFGFVDVPSLSNPSLSDLLMNSTVEYFDLEKSKKYTQNELEKMVLVVQDTFTSSYDAEVVADFIRLLSKLGKRPVLLPLNPNGKALHIRGYLRTFAKTAASTAQFLNQVAKLGLPLVGVDPAMVLCYRDEYQKTLGAARGDFNVMLMQEWLIKNLSLIKTPSQADSEKFKETYYLLAHCTEKSLKPTTHNDWKTIFEQAGIKLEPIPVGCCGMAGLYGHMADNLEKSQNIYRQNWAPVFKKYPIERCLVTGYSCREQVKRMERVVVKHPLQVLAEIL